MALQVHAFVCVTPHSIVLDEEGGGEEPAGAWRTCLAARVNTGWTRVALSCLPSAGPARAAPLRALLPLWQTFTRMRRGQGSRRRAAGTAAASRWPLGCWRPCCMTAALPTACSGETPCASPHSSYCCLAAPRWVRVSVEGAACPHRATGAVAAAGRPLPPPSPPPVAAYHAVCGAFVSESTSCALFPCRRGLSGPAGRDSFISCSLSSCLSACVSAGLP